MRHAMKGRKLGRTTSHRLALFRNQLLSLMDKERIVTTLPKAKELRPLAERVITRGKTDSIPARRWVRQWIENRTLVGKVFDTLAPRFAGRPGGYTRIVKLGPRQGDGAEMAVLEFVDYVAPAKVKPSEAKESGEKGDEKGEAKADGKAKPKAKAKAAKPKGDGKPPKAKADAHAKLDAKAKGGARARTQGRAKDGGGG